MIKEAVIPAVGLGTRFLPATKAHQRKMLPVVDKPVIQYVVESCYAIITGKEVEDDTEGLLKLAFSERAKGAVVTGLKRTIEWF